MKKYVFDNKNFKSKRDVDVYIRKVKNEIVNETGNSEIRPNNKWYHFLMEIVNVHNDKIDKIGNGIEFFYFIKDVYKNDQLRIKRIDETTIDCSYLYSKITQKNEEIILNNHLNTALRFSINDQILNYKNKQPLPLKCNYCGDDKNCEIDHVKPFHCIKADFFKTVNKSEIPIDFDDDIENSCSRTFKNRDKDFENKWKNFHSEHAVFQVLCRYCNRKKSGKINVNV